MVALRYVGVVQGNSASVGVVPGAISLLHTQHVEPPTKIQYLRSQTTVPAKANIYIINIHILSMVFGIELD